VNFFCLKVANATTPINRLSIVDGGEASKPNHVITHNGAEVFKCFYGDDVWQIERCPFKVKQSLFNVAKRY
jgi:hypothetical protein